MIPPVLIQFRMGWLWVPLPVALLWPVFVVGWIVLGLALTAVLAGTGGRAGDAGKIWIAAWRLMCAFRGTRVDVENAGMRVRISII